MAVGRSSSRSARTGLSARLRSAPRAPRADEGRQGQGDDAARRVGDGKRSATQALSRRFKQMSSIAAASTAVALLSVGFSLWQGAQSRAEVDRATEGAQLVAVTQRDVAAGEALDGDAVALKEVPVRYRQESTFDASFLDTSGARALVDIPANTQLSEGIVAVDGADGRLSARLSPGMEAVSLSVDDETGVAGQIKPYDTVRVACVQQASGSSVSLDVVCEAARVLSTGGDGAGEGVAYSAVTIEVTPDEADAVRLAQSSGVLSVQLVRCEDLSGR